jgi:hypothetical protein
MTVPAWLPKALSWTATIATAIGGLGAYVPDLLKLGAPPAWVTIAGKAVLISGIVGLYITHPPPQLAALVNLVFPGLVPAAPAFGPLPIPSELPTKPELVPSVPPRSGS